MTVSYGVPNLRETQSVDAVSLCAFEYSNLKRCAVRKLMLHLDSVHV